MYAAASSHVHPIGYATCIVPPLSLPSPPQLPNGNLSSDHTDSSSSALCSVSPLPQDYDYDSTLVYPRQRYYDDKRELEQCYFPCSFSTSSLVPSAKNERKVVSPSNESMDQDGNNHPLSCNKHCYGYRRLVSQSETASIPNDDDEEHSERQMNNDRDKTAEELPVTLPGPCVASSQLKFGIDRLLAKDVKPNRTGEGDSRLVVYCK